MSPRRRAIITTLLGIFTLSTVALAIHRIHAHWPGLNRIVAEAAEVVQPAPLSAMHRGVEGLGECRSCHATASSIADTKCLQCHREIEERKESKQGFHGSKLDGACAQCHKDHGEELISFDRLAFNHRQTTFPLVEHHAELKCEQCHEKPVGDPHHAGKRFDFIGIAHDSCVSCHRDPHRGELTQAAADGASDRACTACHDQTAWTGRHMSFTHENDAAFELHGAHATLDCRECHRPAALPPDQATLASAKFKGLATDCASCHEDPHRGELAAGGKTCTSCHDEKSWTGRDVTFDHSRDSSFPLRGKHAALECGACHEATTPGGALATADFKHTATGCADCHQDPHDGQFKSSTCADCHQENGFKGSDLLFRHSSVKDFPLTGAHQSVACTACHKPIAGGTSVAKGARFAGLAADCASCHHDPHEGSLAPKTCTACHDTVAWTGPHLSFDHRSKASSDFVLDAMHSTLSCAACHATEVFKPTPTECATCHATQAAHLEGRVEIAGEAEHWTASPHAGLLKCADCHDTTNAQERLEDVAKSCAKCHTQRYATLLLDQRAHLGGVVTEARARLDAGGVDAGDRRRAILDAALLLSSHDYAPAELQARAILESLKKP